MSDYLSCGSCPSEFELQEFPEFMEHKMRSCQLSTSTNILECLQCFRKFHTSMPLLMHLQRDHQLAIVKMYSLPRSSTDAGHPTDYKQTMQSIGQTSSWMKFTSVSPDAGSAGGSAGQDQDTQTEVGGEKTETMTSAVSAAGEDAAVMSILMGMETDQHLETAPSHCACAVQVVISTADACSQTECHLTESDHDMQLFFDSFSLMLDPLPPSPISITTLGAPSHHHHHSHHLSGASSAAAASSAPTGIPIPSITVNHAYSDDLYPGSYALDLLQADPHLMSSHSMDTSNCSASATLFHSWPPQHHEQQHLHQHQHQQQQQPHHLTDWYADFSSDFDRLKTIDCGSGISSQSNTASSSRKGSTSTTHSRERDPPSATPLPRDHPPPTRDSHYSTKSAAKEGRFACDKCSRVFRQNVHLRKHIMSHHEREKPHKCHLCSYSTVEKSHLTVHMRKHTGEKPFRCRACDYSSAQNCTLKNHYFRKHPTSRVPCDTCGEHFVTDLEKNNHSRNCVL